MHAYIINMYRITLHKHKTVLLQMVPRKNQMVVELFLKMMKNLASPTNNETVAQGNETMHIFKAKNEKQISSLARNDTGHFAQHNRRKKNELTLL